VNIKIKKMKSLYLFVVCMLLIFPVSAQLTLDQFVQQDSVAGAGSQRFASHKKFSKLSFYDRTHVSLMAGAGYTAFGKEGVFSTWLAPEISYALTPKFRVSAGVMLMHGSLNNFGASLNNEGVNSGLAGSTQYYVFARGAYLLNDHITITAATMQSLSNRALGLSPVNYNSVGMNVKLSDHFSIGADCVISKGTNPYGAAVNNPFYYQAFPSFSPGR
jgi:hypothetical protein